LIRKDFASFHSKKNPPYRIFENKVGVLVRLFVKRLQRQFETVPVAEVLKLIEVIDEKLAEKGRRKEESYYVRNRECRHQRGCAMRSVAKILSVSYDPTLLSTRHLVLQTEGHEVTSVCGLSAGLEQAKDGTRFDLLIVGHSIPDSDKEALIEAFRASRPSAPIIAMTRPGEGVVRHADLEIGPDPRALLDSVMKLMSSRHA
jgi:CheY-like chemotaxis protein